MTLLGFILMFLMGLTLGVMGGGGSILTVPILIYIFKLSAVYATAYSLFIVGVSSLLGAFKSYKKKQINIKVGLLFAIPGFLGVFTTRAYIVPNFPNTLYRSDSFVLTKDLLILFVFATMMIAASIPMIVSKKKIQKDSIKANKPKFLIPFEGLVVGVLTGFVGAGGGFLIVPALVVLSDLKMKEAVGTSLMIIAIKSIFGFTGDVISLPTINWGFLISLSLLSIMGLIAGSLLANHINEKTLKKAFGYFVLIMGCFILIQQTLSL